MAWSASPTAPNGPIVAYGPQPYTASPPVMSPVYSPFGPMQAPTQQQSGWNSAPFQGYVQAPRPVGDFNKYWDFLAGFGYKGELFPSGEESPALKPAMKTGSVFSAYGQASPSQVFHNYNNGDYSTQVTSTLLPSSQGNPMPYNTPVSYAPIDGGNYYEPPIARDAWFGAMGVPYSDMYLDSSGWTSDGTIRGYSPNGTPYYY